MARQAERALSILLFSRCLAPNLFPAFYSILQWSTCRHCQPKTPKPPRKRFEARTFRWRDSWWATETSLMQPLFLWIAALLSSFSYFLKKDNALLHALLLTWNYISLMFSRILLPMDSFRRLYFTEHSCLDLIGFILSIGCPEVPALL